MSMQRSTPQMSTPHVSTLRSSTSVYMTQDEAAEFTERQIWLLKRWRDGDVEAGGLLTEGERGPSCSPILPITKAQRQQAKKRQAKLERMMLRKSDKRKTQHLPTVTESDVGVYSYTVLQPTAASLASLGLRESDDRRDIDDTKESEASFVSVTSHALSQATSAMTLECTYHSNRRMYERGLCKRQLQAAVKHAGVQAPIVPGTVAGTYHIEHDGTVLVTDATRKVVITAWQS
mmetsp:Transcript_21632/g.35695  ORF Transcript_21632/g.35695 Transcript_21632/m.35695 type:complete len:233 (+) Transcript_21632:66-764(+)